MSYVYVYIIANEKKIHLVFWSRVGESVEHFNNLSNSEKSHKLR